MQQVQHYFEGPIPQGDELARYEEVQPGAAGRIIKMAEDRQEMAREQMQHRQVLEKSVISANIRHESTGQWMGFVLYLLCILGSFYAGVFAKNNWAAGILLGTSTSGVVAIFVTGKVTNSKRGRKDEEG